MAIKLGYQRKTLSELQGSFGVVILGIAGSLDDLPDWNVSETLTLPHEF